MICFLEIPSALGRGLNIVGGTLIAVKVVLGDDKTVLENNHAKWGAC